MIDRGYEPRPFVQDAIRELAKVYDALFDAIPRTEQQASGRVSGTPSPPVPVNVGVLDALAVIESAVPGWS